MSLEEIRARRRQRRLRRHQQPALSTSLALIIGASLVVLSFWGLSRGACRPAGATVAGETPAASPSDEARRSRP